MTVGELKKQLEDFPDDMLVLKGTGAGTLVPILRVGTVGVIPTRQNKNLIPGVEWRVPNGTYDEPNAERQRHLVIT